MQAAQEPPEGASGNVLLCLRLLRGGTALQHLTDFGQHRQLFLPLLVMIVALRGYAGGQAQILRSELSVLLLNLPAALFLGDFSALFSSLSPRFSLPQQLVYLLLLLVELVLQRAAVSRPLGLKILVQLLPGLDDQLLERLRHRVLE